MRIMMFYPLRYINKFLTTASFDDKRHDHPGPDFTVTTPEMLETTEKPFEDNPNDAIRHAAQKLGLNREKLRLAMRRFLKMFPYKTTMHQKLNNSHKKTRNEFCEKVYKMIETEQFDADEVIFSDKAHFNLDGYVNKQNYQHWGTERPEYSQSKSAHPLRITAWAAIYREKIFLTLFEERVTGD